MPPVSLGRERAFVSNQTSLARDDSAQMPDHGMELADLYSRLGCSNDLSDSDLCHSEVSQAKATECSKVFCAESF